MCQKERHAELKLFGGQLWSLLKGRDQTGEGKGEDVRVGHGENTAAIYKHRSKIGVSDSSPRD